MQTKRELDKAICKKAFDKITLEMPLSDTINVSSSIKKYVNDMVSNSFSATEHSVMMVSEEVSAIIQGETPVKRPDPGSFVLDCNIRHKSFPRSLCDLGSSMNLVQHSAAISLGRSFLATAGAIIDVKEGRICLNIGNIPMTFDMEKLIRRPLIDKQTSYVDDISELAGESFIDLCSDGPLEKVLTSSEEATFSVDSRAEEYTRLMDASVEVENFDDIEDNASVINVDRYLKKSVDQQPSSLEDWDPEKAPKIELKQLPAGLKYAYLYKDSYPVIVNANLTNGELICACTGFT
ncbi:PREDICTED: uncharacterized protein LOC106330731 [Brassica oleracea var. oleracea]|uniref:uncharacterized protein LOC106330731 n=1 Tax=Brassica oleracea var. oleracea TaxID=109376 RepID=UPI0006A70E54|nr:PREDICTED: uncharacterized protein LOC106330731 [Brassica oleracea var. oleracea]